MQLQPELQGQLAKVLARVSIDVFWKFLSSFFNKIMVSRGSAGVSRPDVSCEVLWAEFLSSLIVLASIIEGLHCLFRGFGSKSLSLAPLYIDPTPNAIPWLRIAIIMTEAIYCATSFELTIMDLAHQIFNHINFFLSSAVSAADMVRWSTNH